MGALLANWDAGLPVTAIIGIAIGDTAAPLLGAYLLRSQTGFNHHLRSLQDVLRLLIYGVLISTLVSAAIGTFWLVWPDGVIPWTLYGRTFMYWWMGNALGVVLFTITIIAFHRPDTFKWTRPLRQSAVVLFGLLILLCFLVFTDVGINLFGYRFRAFTIFPVVIWAAFVLNLRSVSVLLLVVYGMSLYGLYSGVGRFGTGVLADKIDVWLYNCVLSLLALSMVMVQEQRQRARMALEVSERNLNRSQRIVNMGGWYLDLPTNRITCSDETYRIVGLPIGSKLGLELLLSMVPDDERPFVNGEWQKAINGQPFDMEHRFVVNGQIKWVRETAEVDHDLDGNPIAVSGTVRDITRRKLIEENLRLAANVFEGSGEAILITDADAHVLSVNRAFTQISGYTLEEIKGRNPNILASGKHKTEFYRTMWETINRDGFWQGEIWDKDKSGRIYPKLMSISAIKNDMGEVTHYISIAADISARKEAEKNIHFLAYFDTLTGLPNRILLRDRMEQLLAASHRARQQFALLFVDLDRFKYVNDSLGHAVGDKLLQEVAQRLESCIREGDTVSRAGGDEFIILLREISKEGASSVAEKILQSFAEVCDIEGNQISSHASIGISIYPDHGTDADTLIKNADLAMYRVKAEGRNNFRFFSSDLNFHADQLFSMEKDIRLALERGEFFLHFQPQINIKYGRICGAEALIRWQHPDKGLIPPMDFIAVAEETGQIVQVGEWVLRATCAKVVEWRKLGLPVFPISVNLSIRQLRQAELVRMVAEILSEAGLQPGDLELEITEGIMMDDTLKSMETLAEMHNLGVRLSIDDFGTGYSSLGYLKKLPLDRLKIDKSFVQDITTDVNDEAIVRSVINLGHQFNLQVIAEGVETAEQLDFLRTCGCDEIQGYYLSHPLPADEFFLFIKSKPSLP